MFLNVIHPLLNYLIRYIRKSICALVVPPHKSCCLFLAVIECELLADDVYVLRVNDAGSHQFEGIQPFAVEGENLEDLGALLARVIASKTCYLYQVFLVLVETSFFHLLVKDREGFVAEAISAIGVRHWDVAGSDIRMRCFWLRRFINLLLVSNYFACRVEYHVGSDIVASHQGAFPSLIHPLVSQFIKAGSLWLAQDGGNLLLGHSSLYRLLALS